MKTAEEIAAEVDVEIEAEGGAGGDTGDAGAEPQETEAGKPGAGEVDFTDDDLDPEKIEAAVKAPKPLDNAGILKRLRKVHSRMKEAETWKKEREPWATQQTQARLKGLDHLMTSLSKLRGKDAADKPGALETLLDRVMQGEITDPAMAHAILGELLGVAKAADGGSGAPAGNPEIKALKAEIDALKKSRESDLQDRSQRELNSWVQDSFASVPKQLSAKPEFKELPWKDKAWREEYDDLLEEKVMAWTARNPDKVEEGVRPPILELAESAARVYIKGGHTVLKKQVTGGDGKALALTRSQGPGGATTRKLPKPGDDDAEAAYLKEVAAEVEDELGTGA